MTSSNEGRFQQGSNHCKVPLIIINTAATSSAVPDTITIVGAVPGTVTVVICEVSIESDGAAAPMDVESGRSLVVAAQGRLESPRRPMQLQKKTLRLEDEHRSEVLDTFFRKSRYYCSSYYCSLMSRIFPDFLTRLDLVDYRSVSLFWILGEIQKS